MNSPLCRIASAGCLLASLLFSSCQQNRETKSNLVQSVSSDLAPTASNYCLSEAAFMKITEVEQLDDIRPIVAGDVLWVRMIQDRGEALKVRVAESGMVLLPHIGLMTAQGLTCRQLARLAQKEMERLYYQSSIVTIAQSPNTTGAAMP